MKSLIRLVLLMSALQLAPTGGFCAEAKTYQVTGPILELTDKLIVVQKGDERWEVARDTGTKVDGDLKIGNKVTVHYRMIAVKVETKNGKGEGKSRPAK